MSVPWPTAATRRKARRLRSPRPRRYAAAIASLALVGLVAAWCVGPPEAEAAVQPGHGFNGTVLGWTSWYGTYQLAGIGTVWCIDHGSHAPDAAFGYRRTTAGLPSTAITAMSWIAGRYGGSPDPIDDAAVMLALHDLRGAVYPYGPLDLAHLQPSNLAGFGGQADRVLERARGIKAEALAHAGLTWPLRLSVVLARPGAASADNASGHAGPEAAPSATARVVDAAGKPVSDIVVRFAFHDGTAEGSLVRTTGSDGTATVSLSDVSPSTAVQVEATVPDLRGAIYGPTNGAAQRVIRPTTVSLRAADSPQPPPPPTTTTVPPTTVPPTTTKPPPSTTKPPPPTTTTSPPTTSTTKPPPASTVPSTTLPPGSSSPSTPPTVPPTVPEAGTPPPPPPPTPVAEQSPPAPPPAQQLPPPERATSLAFTGAPLRSWAMIGCGLLFLGSAFVAGKRPADRKDRARVSPGACRR